jgi:hypothetical protein
VHGVFLISASSGSLQLRGATIPVGDVIDEMAIATVGPSICKLRTVRVVDTASQAVADKRQVWN